VRHVSTPEVLRRRRPGPLDAAKEAELVAGVAGARDGDLKAALIRLGRGVLRRESENQP
jgi:hypothetical protein